MTDGIPKEPIPTSNPPSNPVNPCQQDDQAGPHADHRLLQAAAAGLLNKQNAASNANINFSFPTLDTTCAVNARSPIDTPTKSARLGSHHSHIEFRTRTIAPSPSETPSPHRNSDEASRYQRSPLASSSRTTSPQEVPEGRPAHRRDSNNNLSPITPAKSPAFGLHHKTSASSLRPIARTPSFKNSLGPSFGTASAASSTYPSPIISAMGDVTPLPSPLLSGDSPGPWRRLARPPSRDTPAATPGVESVLVSTNGESIAAAMTSQPQRKVYMGLGLDTSSSTNTNSQPERTLPHTRNRSVSEYKPDPMLLPKRMSTVSGSRDKTEKSTEAQQRMRREPHLSAARGLTPVEKPPTPPPSESSISAGEIVGGGVPAKSSDGEEGSGQKPRYEYFEARNRTDGKLRRWRAVKELGQGTFSRVMLATSARPNGESTSEEANDASPRTSGQYDRKTLVAVKVCESGPKGGASEDRIEMSLKRELEIMKSIHHPNLVHLRAWNIEPTRAILVLSYCTGGDLFDVASAHRSVLTPPLVRRIFAELISAVSYLHERRIVHRDIKLENVLVNLTPSELADPSIDWATYPYPVSTLTDLGLARRVADDEKLETRCGSDDYAAPEVIMGQPYDGRAIDAWSLGVLLYALLESRLPFDPLPGTVTGADSAHRMRSRTSHRIARIEWRWVTFAGEDGDHDGDEELFKSKGLLGAMQITEGLLKRARSRWTVDKVAQTEWVKGGIQVEGGVKFLEVEDGEVAQDDDVMGL
ncbi:hypothetical protein MCOR25_001182 [Pyricularia grisea]|uniref:Protein kinase domain-containing protein n=1 Tax=Pyricularia grisea TaxID=148305 RepID=A0A6P8B7L4_PYRGI|nr:hypothetical protein PgNI_05828 [Pyricularia grisea]KAI6381489.1 hypothetical protein MCOR25_001182 [Pyricularia grisea]TLD11312.1 hypothetical protein PgNI_05828 [Pyricularia grisea]